MEHYLSVIQQTMTNHFEAPAMTDFEGKIDYTYGELGWQVERMKHLFRQQGLKPGDKVAICARNCANWGVAFLAVEAYGAIAVSILPDFTTESIYELVKHSEARAMFIGSWVINRLELEQMPNVDLFVQLDDMKILKSSKPADWKTIDAKLEAEYPDHLQNRAWLKDLFPIQNMDDLAVINYTSGSTGSPKGVMVTQKNLSSNVRFGQDNIPNGPGLTYVSMLPLAHMFGMMFEFLYQLAGGTHVYFITKSLTPTLMMKAFSEVHPYMILTVPLVVEKIFKKKIFPEIQKPLIKILWYTPLINIPIRKKVFNSLMNAFGGKVQHLIIGGAALNMDVEKCLQQIHFPYLCGYGMTECAPLICYEKWQNFRFRSCGKVIDRMELKIDSENPYKVEGEVLVRGDNVMRGYYKNIQATDNIFTEDGWMRTGDIGIIDHQGNLFLRGRSKNMILGPSGQNIYPEEIEDKLNALPYVAESVVVDRDGKLVALVYPDAPNIEKEQLRVLMDENLKKLNQVMPVYSKVSEIQLVDQEFEKTPKKSIKRFMYK